MAQIAATLLLLHLFSLRNFAVGNTFAKTETVQAALFGFLLLGDRLGALALAGILVSLVGLVLLSATRGLGGGALNRAAAIGLACGAAFAVAGIGYRAASLSLPDAGGLLMRPAVTLAYVTLLQSVLLTGWLWLRGEGGSARCCGSGGSRRWSGPRGCSPRSAGSRPSPSPPWRR